MTQQTSFAADQTDARHFVVAVEGPNGPAFAICQQIMLLDAAPRELAAGTLERFVRDNALVAAPLAGERASAWLASASTAQSAEDDDDDDETDPK